MELSKRAIEVLLVRSSCLVAVVTCLLLAACCMLHGARTGALSFIDFNHLLPASAAWACPVHCLGRLVAVSERWGRQNNSRVKEGPILLKV
jgi:hypothetical protein